MRGFRNWSLGVMYLGCCMWMAHTAPQGVTEMGNTFISLGVGVTGVVAMRAANKWAENGKK